MSISDDVHNFYENLVLQHLANLKIEEQYSQEFIADLLCMILNQLPTRYIRHDVDMAFYLPASERLAMEGNVLIATTKALETLKNKN